MTLRIHAQSIDAIGPVHRHAEPAGDIAHDKITGNRLATFAKFYQDIIHALDKHAGFQFLFTAYPSNEFVENRLLALLGLTFGSNFPYNLQGGNFAVAHIGDQVINLFKAEMGTDFHHLLGFRQGIEVKLLLAKSLIKHLSAQRHTAIFFLGLNPVANF